ncbi:ABC transporter ATP-binding protein [Legionella jordanis]|uniref:Multidrug ABC transporter ATPase/permease n=1 Tax=Legionella jordanis TaxID=456 RepID=A0A0W0VAD3_9GAMM|nr:ABC transporter ATP-binding protein [Legionella jordanis]KTD17109.1 multidrug ABC transporter ATPase/permease [Legionella jordanis]VEH12694.1 multidrug ABC transporter ATPase/permease [Legionella jordanis]
MRSKAPISTVPILSFLWKNIKPYRWWYVLMFQAPIITAFYVFANNYSLKLLIDGFSADLSHGYSHLALPITLFIVAQIALDVTWRLSNIAEWKAEPHVRRRILLEAYDYIQYHSYQFFQNTAGGTVISKLKGILDGYDVIFANLHHLIGRNFCVVIVSVFVLLLVNTTVFYFMLAWCILFIAVMYPMGLRLNQLSNEAAESKHQIIGRFSDNITNIFSLFYFATRQRELHRADEMMKSDYVPRQVRMYKYDFKFNLIGSVLYWIMLLSVFLFMIHLRKLGDISTGDFIFVMLTTLTVSFDLWAFTTGMCEFLKEMGDFKSSFSILEIEHDIKDNPRANNFTISEGKIEFRNICFAYADNQPVFSNLNLCIKAGEKIGIIGHSGAGKSTLVSLLLKNFKPGSGNILIDGCDLDLINSDSLRSQIALIPQDIMLFHRSIAENIAYAKADASIEEIKSAAQKANIDDYIDSLAEGYNTEVGERGIKLSGGQRQRIAIARAILKNAPIVILDEATSSLDSLTEQRIQQSINLMLEQNKATVIAIAHRLSTIRHMDRIIVMDEGKVIEEGTFNSLIANKHGYFKKLWDSQVNGMVQ